MTILAAAVPFADGVVSGVVVSVAAGAGLLTLGAIAAEAGMAGTVVDLLTWTMRGRAETLAGGGGDQFGLSMFGERWLDLEWVGIRKAGERRRRGAF